MKIRHERPLSDLSFQVRAPLHLELVTGEMVAVESWSLQGFEFPGTSDILPKEAVLSIPFQGVDVRFPVKLIAENGTRFLNFNGLTGRQRETLAVFYHSILSGRMASTNDMITSLDTPVDLVPMEETAEEKAVATTNTSPRAVRVVMTSLIYLVFAIIIFGTLGTGIYNRLATVTVENARIEAPLTMLLAAQAGYVDEVLVQPGDEVVAGQVLVRLETPEGEASLAEVRGRITLLEDRLDALGRRAETFDATLATIRASLAQAADLNALRDRATAAAALTAFDGRYTDDHRALFDARADVGRQINETEEELRRLRRERGRLRGAADALHIMASQDGTVTEIFVINGQFVARGIPVVEIESLSARQARGWVDQSMAAALYPGMAIAVTTNSGLGTERLHGQISALEAGIDPALSPDFGMLISVSFLDLSPEETRAELPHLMPVHVEVMRPWAARLQGYRAMLTSKAEEWLDVLT